MQITSGYPGWWNSTISSPWPNSFRKQLKTELFASY